MKLKNFCTAKETINKTKRQPSEWEKIFANDMTDKGLISNIHIQFIQLNIKKITWLQNGQKNWTFFQRGNADGQLAYEKMLNIVNHQGNANQNHNKVSPHTCQNGYYQTNNRCWRRRGEKTTLVHCWWECKLVQPLWKTV